MWISAFVNKEDFCDDLNVTLAAHKYPSHSLNGGGTEEVGGASQWQIIADYMAACQNTTSQREKWKLLTASY